MRTIKLSKTQWGTILGELHASYPKSTFMIRERMRAKLGFTPRDHQHFDTVKGYYIEQVHLDFFSENKYTMFILKFSEYFGKDQKEIS